LGDIEHQTFTTGNHLREITVVASGCKDNTILSVRRFSKKDPRINLIVEGRRNGKPSAINKILDTVNGETLVLLSGDIRLPDAHFVDGLASCCKDGVGVVACRPVPINGVKTKAGYMGRLLWNLHDRTLMAQVENSLCLQAGEAFAISRAAAGYVPLEVINDDAYLVLKAQIAGYKHAYARDMIILNRTPECLNEILLQRARIIKGHQQLKNIIGVSPSVLDTLIFKRPFIATNVVVQEIRDQIERRELRALWFLQLVMLEIAAHLLSKLRSFPSTWPISESAKWSEDESQLATQVLPLSSYQNSLGKLALTQLDGSCSSCISVSTGQTHWL